MKRLGPLFLMDLQFFNADAGGGGAAGGGEGGNGGNPGGSGDGGSVGGTADKSDSGGKDQEDKKPAVSFATQDEYENALQSAVNDFLKGLGIEKPDDLKAILEEHKSRQEAQKTAEQKLAEREAALKTAQSTVQSLRVENAFILEAIKQGIDPDKLSDALRLADLDKVEVTDAGKVKNIDKVVGDLLTAKPWLKRDGVPRGQTPSAKQPKREKTTIPNIADLRKLQRL